MKMIIETQDLTDEPRLIAYIESQVSAALAPLGRRVRVVRVQLRDVNGPGVGGVDKHCVVAVSLDAVGGRVFDEVHANARASVQLLAARIGGWARRHAEKLAQTGA